MGGRASIVDDIINGKDLFVVLESSYGRHYKESYRLDTIILKGNIFWGKVSNVHSPVGHESIGVTTPLSYAYNNFSDVVCTMNYADKIQRYISSNMYSRMQYKTRGDYKAVICGGGDSIINYEVLNTAIENSLNIKMVICEDNNLIHVVPVHTVELYDDKISVGIDTNFESVPSLLYNFNFFDKLECQFNNAIIHSPKSTKVSTEYMANSSFTIISYMISNNDIYKMVLNPQGEIECTIISYQWFKVYCEV